MALRAPLVAVALLLAGCAAPAAPEAQEAVASAVARDAAALRAGTGAIAGLLVDDRYRPLGDGLVLVQELGRTTRSDADGLFAFLDVPPGAYTLKADVPDHEAIPKTVDVLAGKYSETDLVARRVESADGTVVTQEHSVFIPCSVGFVVNGLNAQCALDGGDDSYSFGFVSNLSAIANVTWLVTEVKTSKPGGYTLQIRAPGAQYAAARFEGDYVKVVLQVDVNNTEHELPELRRNSAWNNSGPFQTILFVDHPHRQTVQDAWPEPGVPQWPDKPCCGLGVSMGVKAKIVQSIFVGEPEVDIATYRVYS